MRPLTLVSQKGNPKTQRACDLSNSRDPPGLCRSDLPRTHPLSPGIPAFWKKASLETNSYTKPIVTPCPRAHHSFRGTPRWPAELTHEEEIICNLLFTHHQRVPRGRRECSGLGRPTFYFDLRLNRCVRGEAAGGDKTVWCIWLKEERTFCEHKGAVIGG